MNKYRVTVTREGTTMQSFDMKAVNSDEAFHKALEQLPDQLKVHTELNIEELPIGATNWGIHFQYEDTVNHKIYSDYLIIHADNEKQAKEYYNSHFKGNWFWFNSGKIEPDGKHIYGSVLETYIAACPGFHADARKEGIA